VIYQIHKTGIDLEDLLEDLSDTADAAEMDWEDGFKVVAGDYVTVEVLNKKVTSTPQWRNFMVRYQVKHLVR
jgi:hypothetical protein